MLQYLLEGYDRSRFVMDVVSLTEIDTIGEALKNRGISVTNLNMNRARPNPLVLISLANHFRHQKTDVVQTWLYHADLAGAVAGLPMRLPVIWNLRQSDLDPKTSKRGTILTAKSCAMISSFAPEHIICCSEASRLVHTNLGYDGSKMSVIGNGVDFTAFKPDVAAGHRIRAEIGISEDQLLVGFAARFHPQKDHLTLIKAAKILLKTHANIRFVLCGEDINDENQALVSMLTEHGVLDYFTLLGERDDVADINNALDIATMSSSYGEGFPNILAEAMACSVPCVATDIGDAGYIVGNTGTIVEATKPERLAEGLAGIVMMSAFQRDALGKAAFTRAQQNFKLETVVGKYQSLYEDTITRRNR
jgi:glycosyltransferase involved in cell wall biosynthesis